MARTETVTVVFTDLVGSTELASRLGHDAYEGLRHEHFSALRAAVAKHNGTEVKTTGDGLMVRFDSAAQALACAIAMQQAIAAQRRRGARVLSPASPAGEGQGAGAAIEIRVGVSAGEATDDGGDLYGLPVVEAARLCAAAGAGQIVVSDVVRLVARGHGHTFTTLGELTLKGLPEPLAAYEVRWEPLAAEGLPLPPRLTMPAAVAMVGRAAESEGLAAAWAKATEGQRQVVLIAGEPGIGKTRLATEAALAAHAAGAAVLFGSCDEDVAAPYRPFVEALRHYVTHAPDDVLAAHVREHRGELGRLLPELGRRVAALPAPQVAAAETERYLLFEAVTGLLSEASQRQPIVLILDDLHWAGAPELLLLKHMLKSAMPLRVLIVGTYRDTDLLRTHPLTAALADFRRETGVQRLALHGLDEAAVVSLVTAAAGHELGEPGTALARVLQRETEGNPFFIAEILRHLSESGAIFRAGERWTYAGDVAGLGIPESVKEVIGRRLGRLSEPAAKLLTLAAVIGRQFDLATLVRVADREEEAVLDALDEAMRAALVTELAGSAGQFSFTHALIRTTLYEELSATRRARLHRTVGEVIEELTRATPGARLAELAHHWLQATRVTDAEKAIRYTRQAGDQALANLAFEEAAAHYERALGVLDAHDAAGERLRCDLLIALGEAQRRAGDLRYRDTTGMAVELARRLGDAERLAVAALGHSRPGGFMANANVVDEALIRLYEEALAALGTTDTILRARLLGQLAVELVYTPARDRREALSAEAVAIARRLNDPAGLMSVLVARLIAMNDPTTVTERLALTAELEALASRHDNTEMQFQAAFHRAGALLESGDGEGAEQAVERLDRLAAELRQPFYRWWGPVGRAMWSTLRGQPTAEQDIMAALETGTAAGNPDAASVFGAQLTTQRANEGRCEELLDGYRSYAEALPHIPTWRTALASALCETDRLAEAQEQFEWLRARDFALPLNWAWSTGMLILAEVCRELGDREAAARLYPRIAPVAEQVGVTVILLISHGSNGYPAGLLAACLGNWEDAERHFADAIAMNERLGARPYLVRTRRAWAAMLLDRGAPGDRERAGELIAAGRAEAERLGMARELVRFERLQAALSNSGA